MLYVPSTPEIMINVQWKDTCGSSYYQTEQHETPWLGLLGLRHMATIVFSSYVRLKILNLCFSESTLGTLNIKRIPVLLRNRDSCSTGANVSVALVSPVSPVIHHRPARCSVSRHQQ